MIEVIDQIWLWGNRVGVMLIPVVIPVAVIILWKYGDWRNE